MIAEISYDINQYTVEVVYDGDSISSDVGHLGNRYFVEVLHGYISGGGTGGGGAWGGDNGCAI